MSTREVDIELHEECCRLYYRMGDEFLALKKKQLTRDVSKAEKALEKASAARRDLGPESSRARITSANARHHAAAEHVWRMKAHFAFVNDETQALQS